ncbi:TIM barrel protein [Rubellicoccus peritrichatus]|uniref:TIM barrel protein n=1 Tax=Rubellicoccus peritrichatus TaxID=3080537 RepID=A0AAQ3LB48_9BACT|nr:TIM barrel protein [Puniceicoccus sp. CR14]WOO41047.1 TIM barrel protein [Puniceicoccus sp. CR14]
MSIIESVLTCQELGFDGFEFWKWDEIKAQQVLEARESTGMPVSAFCTLFTSLTDPDQHDDYVIGLRKSIRMGKRLGCSQLITQVGMEMPSMSRFEMRQHLIDGLAKCVPLLERANFVLLVEPLNPVDSPGPGYFLSCADEAFSIVEELNSPHIKVLFDVYHQQVTQGRLSQRIFNNLDKIGHFHAAGNPGRNEPVKGEINYPFLIRELERQQYNGYIGLEYYPTESVKPSLSSFLDWIHSN